MNLIKKKEDMMGRRSKRACPLVVLRLVQSKICSTVVIVFIVGMFWMVATSRRVVSFNTTTSTYKINTTTIPTTSQYPGTSTATMSFKHENDNNNNNSEDHHHLSPNNSIFSFHRQPSNVIQNYASCTLDPNCHVMYLHIPKTGGTTVEHILGKIHQTKIKSIMTISDFTNSPSTFCELPIIASQLDAQSFMKIIVSTCQQLLQQPSSNHRIIILVTIREPIARTLSGIHQICNKNIHKRDPETQAVCRRCNFETDENYWMAKAQGTNNNYQKLMDYVFYQEDKTPTTLLVDNVDLDSFFSHLEHALPQRYQRFFSNKDDSFFSHLKHGLPQSYQRRFFSEKDYSSSNNNNTKFLKNPESLSVCSFSMNSQMIKALIPSSKIYRNLTLMI